MRFLPIHKPSYIINHKAIIPVVVFRTREKNFTFIHLTQTDRQLSSQVLERRALFPFPLQTAGVLLLQVLLLVGTEKSQLVWWGRG